MSPSDALEDPPEPTLTEGQLFNQLQPLLAVCSTLTQDRPVDAVLDDLLRELRRLVRAQAGAIYLIEGDQLRFVCTQNDARPEMNQTPRAGSAVFGAAFKSIRIPLNGPSLAAFCGREGEALNIADAYQIPESAPYRFDRQYDDRTGYKCQSILVLPLGVAGRKPIGVVQAINHLPDPHASRPHLAPDARGFSAFPDSAMQLGQALASMATIVVANAQLRAQVQRQHLDTIFRLAKAAEFRDNDTGAHVQRVSMYCELIARDMGLPQERCQEILFAAPMHDVGKLGVPDAILNKPGPLTPEERVEMQKHTTIGAQILRGSETGVVKVAESIAISHHEKWDGTGYPHGLSGAAIPVEGRICAVADVFDALTSPRVYKPPFPVEKAYSIIQKDAGTHFDPEAVAAFVRSRDTVEAIQAAYCEVSTNK